MDTDIAYQKYIYGNVVFTDHATPIRVVGDGMSTANLSDNIEDAVSNANNYVNNASSNITTIDLYPRAGSALDGSLIPNSLFTSYMDHSKDFNSNFRNWKYRGAYSGEGTNQGWHLAIDKKPAGDTVSTNTQEITTYHVLDVQLFPNPATEKAYLNFGKPISEIEI
nr:hypothetical protein [Gammaproteobacteria bacterium]